jgi:predicted MPP superfamily phosphohydrolase
VILRIPFIWLPFPINLIFQIAGTIMVIWGFIYEPSKINITQKEINTPLNTDQTTKFIHIGDLHLEEIGQREEDLLSKLTIAKPDFILFTGDFLNLSYRSDPEAIKTVAEYFNKIQQIAPIYWVTGSPAVDLEKSISEIHSLTNATWIKDTSLLIQNNIELIGINCTHQPHNDFLKIDVLKRINQPVFTILIYHSPDLILELNSQKIDLMLSGHTHGGQVRLPLIGALFTGSLYGRNLQAGEYWFHNTMLYITRGIGLEGLGAPRVRFLCPPEIIEWTIHH